MKEWTEERWDETARNAGQPTIHIALITWYILEAKPSGVVARKLGCGRNTVDRLLKAYEIPRRGPKLANFSQEEIATWTAKVEKLKQEFRARYCID